MYTIQGCVEELISLYNINNQWLKPPTKSFKGVLTVSFFTEILRTSSLEEAAYNLGVSSRTLQRIIKTINNGETFSSRGGNIRYYFLDLLGLKLCNGCGKIFSHNEFHRNEDRLKSICKSCSSIKFSRYYENNKQTVIANVSSRTEHILKATPKWADITKIREIYNKCPKGMHVDHIIPLRGKIVSGLHVETNLQYLSKEENLKKGNSWEVS